MECKKKPTQPDDNTPKHKRQIFLYAVDTSVTEITLKVAIPESVAQRTFVVKRDTQTILSALCSALDTTFTDTALSPNHNYTYKAYRLKNNKAIDSSIVHVTTMDTTSHNFAFEIDTLGDGSSSTLYDVAILNDTLAYAVGAIYLRDSTGQIDPHAYGFAKWNGNKWTTFRLVAVGPTGVPSNLRPRGIFAFSENDIWFASGGVFHWNGHQDTVTPYWINMFSGNPNPILSQGQTAEKIWGTSSSNLYIVGHNGAIAKFDGTTWMKITSGTTLPINDICGATNKFTSEQEILCVASNTSQNNGSELLRIHNSTITVLPSIGLSWSIGGVWLIPGKEYYVVGEGLYVKKNVYDSTEWKNIRYGLTNYGMAIVRGIRENNIVVVGSYGNFLHFNGIKWNNLHAQTYLENGTLGSVDIKGSFVIAVGHNGSKAVIIRGYHL